MRMKSYGHFSIGVDMTMGNGHDTLALAHICDEVYSFDIQKQALDSTALLVKDYSHVHLILDNHAYIDKYIQECDIAIFNLGYLPQFSHEITTVLETTRIAIEKIIQCTKKVIFIVVYPGHKEGMIESEWIDEFVCCLSSKKYNVSSYRMLNKNKSPYVIEIEIRK